MTLAKEAIATGETYDELLARPISDDDSEQIQLDVCRSGVDDLERIAPSPHDQTAHRAAIDRMLRAWCARHQSSGYCQGMNFIASVLLAVMGHGAPPIPISPTDSKVGRKPVTPGKIGHGERSLVPSRLSAAELGSLHETTFVAGEEAAFWTFVALVEGILPGDFYTPPRMIGLQREVQVLQQLARREIPQLFAPDVLSETDALAVLSLVAYKWFPPCFVNQLPIMTLLLCWDILLLRPSPTALLSASGSGRNGGGGRAGSRLSNLAAGHLRISLALIASCAPEIALRIGPHGEDAVGVSFGLILQSAVDCANSGALLSAAKAIEVTPEQLGYLRARLAAADERGKGGGPLERPPITRLQETTLTLLSHRSSYMLEFLMQALLLRPPPPPPVAGALSYLPHHYARLVSTCVITSVSALMLSPYLLYRLTAPLAKALLSPCTFVAGILRRWRFFASHPPDDSHSKEADDVFGPSRLSWLASGLWQMRPRRLKLFNSSRFAHDTLPIPSPIFDDAIHSPLPQSPKDEQPADETSEKEEAIEHASVIVVRSRSRSFVL